MLLATVSVIRSGFHECDHAIAALTKNTMSDSHRTRGCHNFDLGLCCPLIRDTVDLNHQISLEDYMFVLEVLVCW